MHSGFIKLGNCIISLDLSRQKEGEYPYPSPWGSACAAQILEIIKLKERTNSEDVHKKDCGFNMIASVRVHNRECTSVSAQQRLKMNYRNVYQGQ